MKNKDQQAQQYAEKMAEGLFKNPWVDPQKEVTTKFKQAYSAGYTACEQSMMWRSVEDELPEDDRLVLAHFSDVDPELSYATAYYRDGAWQTPDDWYYDCKIDFWKPIMPPSLSDTNTEKK